MSHVTVYSAASGSPHDAASICLVMSLLVELNDFQYGLAILVYNCTSEIPNTFQQHGQLTAWYCPLCP